MTHKKKPDLVRSGSESTTQGGDRRSLGLGPDSGAKETTYVFVPAFICSSSAELIRFCLPPLRFKYFLGMACN
jgi:hypothetical protein